MIWCPGFLQEVGALTFPPCGGDIERFLLDVLIVRGFELPTYSPIDFRTDKLGGNYLGLQVVQCYEVSFSQGLPFAVC